MGDATEGPAVNTGPRQQPWDHLTPEELQYLQEAADDPRNWELPAEEFVEPIIGWSVVFSQEGTLGERLFRDEDSARRAATTIQNAVISTFSTTDASWHQWEDQA